MFGFLGNATRFAGDRLNDAYKSFDNQLGGILPGGAEVSGSGLISEIARDALPGDRKVSGAGIASKVNNSAENVASGDIAAVSAQLHGGKVGAEVREQTVEAVRDKALQKAGAKVLSGPLRVAAGVVAPPVMIADRANDVKDAYSTFLEVMTGKDLDSHMRTAADKRDPLYGRSAEPTYVEPSDGSTVTLEQRDKTNPFLQEFRNRTALVGSNFNPLEGDWGITEALYGR